MSTESSTRSANFSYQNYTVRYDIGLRKEVMSEKTTVGSRQVFSSTRTSQRTPGFHNPNRGRLKPLAFSYVETVVSPASGYLETRNKNQSDISGSNLRLSVTQGQWNSDDVEASLNLEAMDTSLVSKLTDQVNQKVLGKVKNSGANVGVISAEAGKTMSMVGSAAANMAGAIVNLRRGNFAAAASNLGVPTRRRSASRFKREYARDASKAVASGWLSLQYGWKPMMSDIYAACDSLSRLHLNDQIVVSSSRQSRTIDLRSRRKTSGPPDRTFIATGSAKYTVQTSVRYIRPNSSSNTAKESGVINPAEVAWELLPYSFVVDWFLPIGAYLNTLDATVGLTFLDGYTTVFFKSSIQNSETTSGTDGSLVYSGYRQASKSRVYCTRTPLGSFPSAGIPRFKNPASAMHLASGMALLTNLFGR